MTVQWEKVHVFISSTFNDMHAERDYLVKRVFPELHDWCERRKLRLVDVDLRWGVTEEDATANANVVRTCLNRIDDCRPFFVCLLGQRYGWTPKKDDVSPETFTDYPGLDQAVDVGASVTELEILHAIVSPFHEGQSAEGDRTRYHPAEHTFFYLRDASYLEDVPADPPKLRRIYSDEDEGDEGKREQLRGKLHRLREETIPNTGRPVRRYQARWDPKSRTPEIALPLECPALLESNVRRWQKEWQQALGLDEVVSGREILTDLVADAEAYNQRLTAGRLVDFKCVNGEGQSEKFHDVILADLKAAVAKRYPEHMEIEGEDDLQRELDQHEEFLFTNSEGFISRRDDFAELDEYVQSDSRHLFVLTAQGGMGKSMILAKWIDQCRKDPAQFPDTTFHARFIGQSDGSTTVAGLLRYLLRELQEVAGKIPMTTTETRSTPGEGDSEAEVALEIPADPRELRSFWRRQLPQLGHDGKTVIVIDGLNQLETGLRDLAWLPTSGLPENLKLVVSFRRGDKADEASEALHAALARNEHVWLSQVTPFDDEEDRRRLVDTYLKQYLKELDEERVDQLIGARGASNPLFLKVLLSELRVFGAFQQLEQKIQSDFGQTPVEAFRGVLKRLETDPAYTAVAPAMGVPLLFGLLLHARHGLSAQELAALFFENLTLTDAQQDQAEEAVYLFLRQVKPFLGRREGRYDFFYESFQRAAGEQYVIEEPKEALPARPPTRWHGLLADHFASLPLYSGDGTDRTANRRKLAELPYQQARAHRWHDVQSTLTDFKFLQAKVSAVGPQLLIDDYDIALAAGYTGRDLSLVLGALSLSAHILSRDQQQLASQLTGRLISQEDPDIQALLKQIQACHEGPWLRPLTPSLEAPGGALLRTFEHGGPLTGMAILDDGRRMLTASDDATYRVWNPDEGVELRTLSKRGDANTLLGVIADGQRIVSSSKEGTIEVWDLETEETVCLLQGHTDRVQAIASFDEGRRAISASSDETLRIWDMETGNEGHTLTGHSAGINAVAVLNDGRRAITASMDQTLRLWDLESGETLRILQLQGHYKVVLALEITDDGQQAICGCMDGTLQRWNLDQGTELELIGRHGDPISTVTVFDSGQRIISGSWDGMLKVWDLETGRNLQTLEGHPSPVRGVAVFNEGRRAISASTNGVLQVWDLQVWEDPVAAEQVTAIAIFPDGQRALSISNVTRALEASRKLRSRFLKIWDLQSGIRLRTLQVRSDWLNAVAVFDDGHRAICASDDKSLQIWDLKSGRGLPPLTGHTDHVKAVAVFNEGKRAISGSWDYTLKVWDLEAWMEVATLRGHTHHVNAVALFDDGRRAVSASYDQTLKVWDLESCEELCTLEGHSGPIESVAVTPDGCLAISGSWGEIKVWDLETGEELNTVQGHIGIINAVATLGNGRRTVSASGEGSVAVWDLESGALIASFVGETTSIECCAVTPDGSRLIAGDKSGQVHILELIGFE